jgi:hypothetical protein
MSKFLKVLEKKTKSSPGPIGFGSSISEESRSTMALVGLISSLSAKNLKLACQPGLDAVLLQVDKPGPGLAKTVEALSGKPLGIRTGVLSKEESSHLVKIGCDFFIHTLAKTHVDALYEGETGYILKVDGDIAEQALRALNLLPVDAVFVSLSNVGSPLTLCHLADIVSIRIMFEKFLIVEIPRTVSAKEIEILRDSGVDGLVVDITNSDERSISSLQKILNTLPRQKYQRRNGNSGTVSLAGRPAGDFN